VRPDAQPSAAAADLLPIQSDRLRSAERKHEQDGQQRGVAHISGALRLVQQQLAEQTSPQRRSLPLRPDVLAPDAAHNESQGRAICTELEARYDVGKPDRRQGELSCV